MKYLRRIEAICIICLTALFLYYGIRAKLGFIPEIPTWVGLTFVFGVLGVALITHIVWNWRDK